VSKEVSER